MYCNERYRAHTHTMAIAPGGQGDLPELDPRYIVVEDVPDDVLNETRQWIAHMRSAIGHIARTNPGATGMTCGDGSVINITHDGVHTSCSRTGIHGTHSANVHLHATYYARGVEVASIIEAVVTLPSDDAHSETHSLLCVSLPRDADISITNQTTPSFGIKIDAIALRIAEEASYRAVGPSRVANTTCYMLVKR